MNVSKVNSPFFRRRNILIKPDYQVRVVLGVLISIVVYSGLLGFFIFFPLAQELLSTVSIAERGRISEVVLHLHRSVWPGLLVISILIALQVILSTHRVAGPVYRLEVAIEEFLSGDFSRRMTLRKGDRFKSTGESFNALAEYLEGVKEADERFHAHIKEKLSQVTALVEKGGGESMEEARRILGEMETGVARYDNAFMAAVEGRGG